MNLQSKLNDILKTLASKARSWYAQMNSNAALKYNSQLGLYSSSFLQRDHWPEASRHKSST
jgi:hypothetical protein